ncbi:MAG: flagellar hook protein FlgE [Alphaproteobacteria bacterium]
MIGGVNIPLSGMNAAAAKLNASAANIAARDVKPDVSLTGEIVSAKGAKFTYAANAEMLHTMQEMSGTLLDIFDDD